jgi:AraC family transcriptional regulator
MGNAQIIITFATMLNTPRIVLISSKKLVGKRLAMSLVNNLSGMLWGSFMPIRKTISNAVGTDLYSLQNYPARYFEKFDATRSFEKWALTEVSDHDNIPEGMQAFVLPGGMYAVFEHVSSDGAFATFKFIFEEWLPKSNYSLGDRPHFEVLGEEYKRNDPGSKEAIWIPIKNKL